MLQLRPICEHCATDLPPESTVAMICSYECTFCRDCVVDVLGDVCPNCGGGFQPRPARPVNEWLPGISLAKRPAVTERTHHPVDPAAHAVMRAMVVSAAVR
jgi:hypothetical protein